MIVDPAPDDHVDLDRAQPDGQSRIDPVEDPRDREVDAVHRAEDRVVQRVETDGHALQAGVLQRPRQRPERSSVRGQREIQLLAVRRAQGSEHRDEIRQTPPNERLPAGDPQLLHAQRDERPRGSLDLLEGEDLVARQEREVAPKDFPGHAVGAPEVAAIGDRDAQVAERPSQRVEGFHASHILPRRSWCGPTPGRAVHQPHGTTGVTRWYH